MKWVAIYQKYPPTLTDPFDFEIHGWEVAAANPDEAIEILEKRWDVPWRIFLVEVVLATDLEEWQQDLELEPRHRVRLHK
ncbi:MAG: hypothetical protein RIM23_09990 [Coleofasciculus sp. G3-WIS-01]|uniref:hypothetical protein n=1 Tax=Coleofasciculus sp. G3-WIS-01 TaxID=3069528 RepID=UPI0032FDC1E0